MQPAITQPADAVPTVKVTLTQGEAWVVYQAMLGVKDAAIRQIVDAGSNRSAVALGEAKYNAAERVITALTIAS